GRLSGTRSREVVEDQHGPPAARAIEQPEGDRIPRHRGLKPRRDEQSGAAPRCGHRLRNRAEEIAEGANLGVKLHGAAAARTAAITRSCWASLKPTEHGRLIAVA